MTGQDQICGCGASGLDISVSNKLQGYINSVPLRYMTDITNQPCKAMRGPQEQTVCIKKEILIRYVKKKKQNHFRDFTEFDNRQEKAHHMGSTTLSIGLPVLHVDL